MKQIVLTILIILGILPAFAQQTGTGAKGQVADNDSLAAWYEKTLQLSGITVTGRAADKKVTVEKTSINWRHFQKRWSHRWGDGGVFDYHLTCPGHPYTQAFQHIQVG